MPPCEDFYRFACGGWIAKNEIPPDKPRWSRGFHPLRERNLAELRAILDTEAAGKIDPRDRFADKVADFYASCMDEPGVEARALDELRAEAIGHSGVTALSVTTPRFVARVGKLFAEAPLHTWKTYLAWHLLREMASARALPKAFVDEGFAFSSESFTGAKAA